MLVPVEEADWATQSEEGLTLRYAAYWLSLSDHVGTDNTETVTVFLPRTQLFTPESLRGIMGRVDRGQTP